MAGAKLEVRLEMVDYALTSNTTAGTKTYERTRLQLTDTDYDAATFWFEVNATNSNASNAYSVQLVYWTGSVWSAVTNAVVSVPLSTTNAKTIRATSSFTPISGATLYAVQMPATATAGNLTVQDARIVVVQTTSATKTRIQIPLTSIVYSSTSATNDNTIFSENDYATAYGHYTEAVYGLFDYNASEWADIPASGITLETVASAASASYAVNFALAPSDALTTVVTGTPQGADITSTTITLYTASVSQAALTDGKNYALVAKSAGTTSARGARIYRAALYVKVSNANGLMKFANYLRLTHQSASNTTAAVLYYHRQQLTTANFAAIAGGNVKYYIDAKGTDTTNETNVTLYDQSTTANNNAGSAVSNATVAFNGTTQMRRSAAFTPPTSGNYVAGYKSGASTNQIHASYITILTTNIQIVSPTGADFSGSTAFGAITAVKGAVSRSLTGIATGGAFGTVTTKYNQTAYVGATSYGLTVAYEASSANGGTLPGSGSLGTWTSRISGPSAGTLTGFSYSGTSGWVGSGTNADPTALSADAGHSDYVSLPDHATLRPAAPFSFEAWYFLGAQPAANAYVFDKRGTNTGFGVYVSSDGSGNFRIGSGAGWAYIGVGAPGWSASSWIHVVGTLDAAGNAAGWQNGGVGDSQIGVGYAASSSSDAARLFEETGGAGTSYPFDGKISAIRIYNRVLSAAEVAKNYAAGPAGRGIASGEAMGSVTVTKSVTRSLTGIAAPDGTSSATFYSGANDGQIFRQNADYETARSGGGSLGSNTSSSATQVGQWFDGSLYGVYEFFMSFDTSSIGAGITPTLATLSLQCSATPTFSQAAEVRVKDWGATADTGDYVAGSDLTSYPLVATSTVPGSWVSGQYVDFVSQSAFLSNIATSGTTYLFVSSDQARLDIAPTATDQRFNFRTGDGTAGQKPKLYVEWSTGTSFGTVTVAKTVTKSLTGIATGGAFGAATAQHVAGATQTVNIASPVGSGLISAYLGYEAKSQTLPGNNTDPTSTWKDLRGASDITVSGLDWTATDGWAGSGTTTSPYQLVGDGTIGHNVTFPTPSALATAHDFTIEIWCSLGSVGTNAPTLNHDWTGNSGVVFYYQDSNGEGRWVIGNGTTEIYSYGGPVWASSALKHYVLTYDATNHLATVYDNGSANPNNPYSVTFVPYTATGVLRLWNPDDTAMGATAVSALRVYDRVLAQVEVTALTAAGPAGAGIPSAEALGSVTVTKSVTRSLTGFDSTFVVSSVDSIPTMTGATTPSGVVSANDSVGVHVPYKAFNDSNADNYDNWEVVASAGWLSYQFPSSLAIGKYTITTMTGPVAHPCSPKTWTFEGSANGSSWDVLDTQTNVVDWAESKNTKESFSISNTSAYLYYRVNISDSNTAGQVAIAELEMMSGVSVFGTVTTVKGAVTKSLTGIASGEALGTVTVLKGTVSRSTVGIMSISAAGSTTINCNLDGHVNSNNASYAQAARAATVVDSTGTSSVVGQNYTGGTYRVFQTFLSFDTTPFSGAVFISSLLTLFGFSNFSDTEFEILVSPVDFSYGGITTSDFVSADNLGGDIVGGFSSADWLTGGSSNQFLIGNHVVCQYSGLTSLLLFSSGQVTLSAPTGAEYVRIYTSEGSHPANLAVTWTPAIGNPTARKGAVTRSLTGIATGESIGSVIVLKGTVTRSLTGIGTSGTFGQSGAPEGMGQQPNDYVNVNRFALSTGTTVTKLTVYVSNISTSGPIKGVIFSDDGGSPSKPNVLLATTVEYVLADNQAEGWVELTLSSPVYLQAGTYWLGILSGVWGFTFGQHTPWLADYTSIWEADSYSDGARSPFTGGNWSGTEWCIYATYDSSAVGPVIALKGAVTRSLTGIAPPDIAGVFDSAIFDPAIFGTGTAAIGSVTVTRTAGVQTRGLTGIATGEALGAVTVTKGAVARSLTGIASAEALVAITVVKGAVTRSAAAPSGLSLHGLGTSDTLALLGMGTSTGGVVSAGAFGVVSVAKTNAISLTGISSALSISAVTVLKGAVSRSLTGIATAEVFGSVTITKGAVSVSGAGGLASALVFGAITTLKGSVSRSLTGIATAEALGTLTALKGAVTRTLSGIATAEVFGAVTIAKGAVTRTCTGIATAEAFGAVTVAKGTVSRNLTGIASGEAFGAVTRKWTQFPAPSGFDAGPTVFGAITRTATISRSLTGIGTAEGIGAITTLKGGVSRSLSGILVTPAFGSPTLTLVDHVVGVGGNDWSGALGAVTVAKGGVTRSLTGIASAEALGAVTVAKTISRSLTGIATAEALGSLTVTKGTVTRTLSGIATGEAFGAITVAKGAVTRSLSGIATAEAFGAAAITKGAVTRSLNGIATAEALGAVTTTKGGVSRSLTGIATAEALGSVTIVKGTITKSLTGIASGEAFGGVTVVKGTVTKSLSGIASSEVLGSITTLKGGVSRTLTGIATAGAFGSVTLTLVDHVVNVGGCDFSGGFGSITTLKGGVSRTLSGIPSAEAMGAITRIATISRLLSGIASAEALGAITVAKGTVTRSLTGIASAETLGSVTTVHNRNVSLAGLDAGATAFGSITVAKGAVTRTLTGLATAEAFGAVTRTVGGVSRSLTGISTGAIFGSPTITLKGSVSSVGGCDFSGVFGSIITLKGGVSRTLTGITTAEAIGVLTVVRTVKPSGITSAEVLGVVTVQKGAVSRSLTGIATSEAFGSLTVAKTYTVVLTGIATGLTFGTVKYSLTRLVTGISTSAAFGSVTITEGGVNVANAGGLASALTFGAITTLKGGVSRTLSGIASGEALGSVTIQKGGVSRSLTGLDCGATVFGSITAAKGTVTKSLSGIATAEAFGAVTATKGGVSRSLTGLDAGATVFGAITRTVGGVSRTLSGIGSAEVFGAITPLPGGLTRTTSGIASGEALGTVTRLIGTITRTTTGIVSGEALGSVTYLKSNTLSLSALASGLAFGSVTIAKGVVSRSLTGIATGEAFGSVGIALGSGLRTVTGIQSSEVFGSITVLRGGVTRSCVAIVSPDYYGLPTWSAISRRSTTGIVTSEAFGAITVQKGGVSRSLSGIASAGALSSATTYLLRTVALTGIASGEAYGPVTIGKGGITRSTSGVASGEAFGAITRSASISRALSGLATGEAFGSVSVVKGVIVRSLTGIPTSAAMGAVTRSAIVSRSLSGIATGEAFGVITRLPGTVSRSPIGIGTGEALGAPSRTVGAVTRSLTSITSGEAFGSAGIALGQGNRSLSGIGSSEAFGFVTAIKGPVSRSLTGIASALAFGAVTTYELYTCHLVGISSAEAFGAPTHHFTIHLIGIWSELEIEPVVVLKSNTETVGGIASALAFGTPTWHASITVAAQDIPSETAFGMAGRVPGGVTRSLTGIPSGVAFGILGSSEGGIVRTLNGIATGEAMGTVTVARAGVNRSATGISSALAFGSVSVVKGVVLRQLSGIPSGLIFGSLTLSGSDWVSNVGGIASGEAFGNPLVEVIKFVVFVAGVPSGEVFGTPQINVTVPAAGIATGEAVGSAHAKSIVIVSAEGIPTGEVVADANAIVVIRVIGIPSAENIGVISVASLGLVHVLGIPTGCVFGRAWARQVIYGIQHIDGSRTQTSLSGTKPSSEEIGGSTGKKYIEGGKSSTDLLGNSQKSDSLDGTI